VRPGVVFDETAHETWGQLYAQLAEVRAHLAHPTFVDGLNRLGITGGKIPDLNVVNDRLIPLTGWRGFFVDGLEGPREFFAALAERRFPVGNFIRSARDLSYTPAPDVFHDLYGHLPLLTDRDYASFCQSFGRAALSFADNPAKLRQFERVFWFGVEFPLIETKFGRRIFGGGILSSLKESLYCLGPDPEVRSFDWQTIRNQEFKIDELQKTLYVLKDQSQLYSCVDALTAAVANT